MRRAAAVLVLLVARSAFAWGGAPDWVKEAARMQVPSYPADTAGVILLDERRVTVLDSGEIRVVQRVVTRILSTDGRDLGYAAVAFNSLVQLQSFHAWSITASGDEYEVKEREAIETAASDSALYEDQHTKVIRIPAPAPGTVVAYEYETREPAPQVLQDAWHFQTSLPVRHGRYMLTLPNGWSHDEVWLNGAAPAPQVAGNAVTWDVNDVTGIKEETRRPPIAVIGRRLAINFYSGARTARRSWKDFGIWYNGLVAARRQSSPGIVSKTQELVAGKSSTWDKLAAVTSFAQRDIRYVAIEIGIGGYQPHAAMDVFRNRFGDCKDKVTTLSAMLHEIGMRSYYVIVSTTRGAVDPEFPSMSSFNHAIIAIEVPADLKSDRMHAIVNHPKLGRLLIFDPTSETTALGDLPSYLQKNRALLVSDEGGELIELPSLAPDTNELRRTAKLTLDDAGRLSGSVREVRKGMLASSLRAALSAVAVAERTKYFEQSVAYHLADSRISDLTIENLENPNTDLVVTYKFNAPSYAKRAGNLLLIRPRVLGAKAETIVDLKERAYPYETEGPSMQVDEFEIATPAALKLDELPGAARVATPSVTYSSETKFEDGILRYRREYRVTAFDVPVSGLPELNKAFTAILADERGSAVFASR
jgi:hypothetical protein